MTVMKGNGYSKNCNKLYLQFFLHWDYDYDLSFTAI